MQEELFAWQRKCLDSWQNSGYMGIVNAVTGSGKTVLALNAVKRLQACLGKNGENLKVRVIVPKTFLISQWRTAIMGEIGVSRQEIGCYCGTHKDNPSLRYMVYVLNSARFSLSRHILADIQKGFHVLLIVDECHHCAGAINSKIFDFVPCLAENASQYHSLALSATSGKVAADSRFKTALGGVIYRYGLSEALRENVVSAVVVFHVGLSFLPQEREEYEELSVRLAKAVVAVRRLCPALRRLSGAKLFARLEKLAAEGGATGSAAAQVMLLSFRRKEVAYLADNRIGCACDLVRLLPNRSKIIIFGERIECAKRIYARLCESYPGQVAMYHSGMNRDSAKNALFRYQNGEARILVGCRALDEGLNVPETDVGIVASSSQTELQRVQRLGRILRRKGSPFPAKLYYLYLHDSSEEGVYLDGGSDSCFQEIPIEYDGGLGLFSCPEGAALTEQVLAYGRKRKNAPDARAELLKNIELCLVRGDYCLSEDLCAEARESAASLTERNYWTTALLLARARLEKL